MPTLYINGKFAAQPLTGVQRYARNLVSALDDRGTVAGYSGTVLLCPANAEPPPLRSIGVRVVGRAGGSLHRWEQTQLPVAARAGWLLNLAGSGPWLGAAQGAVIHDAAVFDRPGAYTTAFNTWYRALFRRRARRGDRLITVSRHARDRLAHWLAVPADRIAVVPNGSDHLDGIEADDAWLRDQGLLGRPFLLAIFSTNSNKNLPRLLQAYASLPPGERVPLVLAGGRAGAGFQAGAALSLPEGVLRLPSPPDAVLKAVYGQATALLLPSLYEGFGLPAVEAMRLGCPVLAAEAGALPEVCGDAALYVDPQSTASMVAGIRRMLAEPALRARLAAAGRAQAGRYTWAAAAQCLSQAIERPSA